LTVHQSESLVLYIADKIGIPREELGKKVKDGVLKDQKARQGFLTNPDHSIAFHYTPKHASWMNQVEIRFSILVRKLLRIGSEYMRSKSFFVCWICGSKLEAYL